MNNYTFTRGGSLNSAIPNISQMGAQPVRPLNTALWGNINRGGRLTSAVPRVATIGKAGTGILGKIGTGILGNVGTGLKFLASPLGAGIGAAASILKPQELNVGEDDKLRELGILPPLPFAKPNVPPSIPNSVTPLAVPPITIPATMATPTTTGIMPIPSQLAQAPVQGSTNLNDIIKSIQSVQPVESYAHRLSGLEHGNTTWDMNGLQTVLAARNGQQADEKRYGDEVGALATMGSAAMNSDAAKYGYQSAREGEQAKIAAMAPYYASEVDKNKAQAAAAPTLAKADILKALNEKAKNNPVLEAALKQLVAYGAAGDSAGYNDYAKKISLLTGQLLPPMLVQD